MVACAEPLLDGEGACAEPLASGIPNPHPVRLLLGNVGSGICFIGSGADGLAGGGAVFICACASPAVPSAANSATAYSVRFN